jgi:diguanylate cyclase (GGDEF)-like protein/PAS domain S-box-containing protein
MDELLRLSAGRNPGDREDQKMVSKILVVDADSQGAFKLCRGLETFGYQVRGPFPTGATALASLPADPVDLAIVDVYLDGSMDGIELAERLRRDYNVPSVITATWGDDDTIARSGAIRPLAWLLKPVDARALHAAIAAARGHLDDDRRVRHLEERLQQVEATFESAADGLFVTDAQHRIIAVNPAFTQITGFAPAEALGADASKLLDTVTLTPQFFEDLRTSDGVWRGQAQCRRRDGSAIATWQTAGIVRDRAGGIPRVVHSLADISALDQAHKLGNYLASHDPLTALPNRVLLDDRLDQAMERARRDNLRCAVLFVDLDGFKGINDTMGHAAGDQLLQSVATRLSACLRRSDTAARIGGDEFVVLLGEIAKPEDAARLAARILDSMRVPHRLGRDEHVVTASVGVAVFPEDGRDRPSLLRASDAALYDAKLRGRDRYCCYSPGLALRTTERLTVERGLRRAIERGDLRVYYQPLVTLESRHVCGFEALVRWQDRHRGLILPDRFIAIAEDTGLIRELGRWVLHTACHEVAPWLPNFGRSFRLAVNVSARQLTHAHFPDVVREVLQETGFPPDRLELELTERTLQTLSDDPGPVADLKALGVSIAIDDFGTGYSSPSMLKHLPVDRVKIDRSFVRDINRDANDVAIVQAISAMSRTLGLSVLAEGIEEDATLRVVRGLGCVEGQGFYFGHPAPASELALEIL